MPTDTPPESPDASNRPPEPTETEETWSLWKAVEESSGTDTLPPPIPQQPGAPAAGLFGAGAAGSGAARSTGSGAHHASHSGRHRSSGGSHKHKHRRHRRRVRWGWIAGGVGIALLLLLIAGGIAGFRFMNEVKQVQAQLTSAKTGLDHLGVAVKAGNQSQMKTTAQQITADVEAASHTVNGSLWVVAAHVPVVGKNVDAVQRVTRAMNILTGKALTPGLEVMSSLKLNQLALKGGGIDLTAFKKAQTSIPTIAAAFTAAQAELAPIDRAGLMSQVSGPVDQIDGVINSAAPQLQFAQKYLPTLLNIAGGSGKKTYLLIFQNNAEIRATGGNPAASMIMTVNNGHFKELDQASSTTFYTAGTAGTSYTSLPAAAAKLYRSDITTYSQNFTMTPNFPTTATLFQNEFKHTNGSHFDGVISIDPVVLSQMLAVAGPVQTSDGTKVTSDNAVKLLLSDVYEKYQNGAESDAFFSDVSKRVFNHLVSAHWDPTKMLDALTTSAQQQRIYLNFTDPKAQALAVEMGLDGALRAAGRTTMGMYLNDSSVSKLEYWLTQTVNLQCNASSRTATETITLKNSIPDSIQSRYTLGLRNGSYGLSNRTMMLDLFSFAPAGGSIVSTTPSTGQVAAWNRSGVDQGSRGVSRTVFVPQGKTVTVKYTVKLPQGDLGKLDLRYSPTARDTKVTIGASCNQLFSK
ncbi:hypothetical protein LK09_03340 [Microbacterium mangrovi]|uniref:DUF4012 domain-containing protein n=1 Tax=Microbacterium mangrovi TaxID=1348253 RepID=A0A0B2ACG8_9MICO|nr:DUF4012 domain-containing protein [Microbacterium mangrovi]KHK99321.1 hypothetical protein LK09_03340 [Microbacterium mangrovi]